MPMLSVSLSFFLLEFCSQDSIDLVGMLIIHFNEIQVSGKTFNLSGKIGQF